VKKFIKFVLYVLAGWVILFVIAAALVLGSRWLGFGVILVAFAAAIGIPVLFAVFYLVKHLEKSEGSRLVDSIHSDDD